MLHLAALEINLEFNDPQDPRDFMGKKYHELFDRVLEKRVEYMYVQTTIQNTHLF